MKRWSQTVKVVAKREKHKVNRFAVMETSSRKAALCVRRLSKQIALRYHEGSEPVDLTLRSRAKTRTKIIGKVRLPDGIRKRIRIIFRSISVHGQKRFRRGARDLNAPDYENERK